MEVPGASRRRYHPLRDAKKLDEIGCAIGNVSWPTMIYVGQLTEEIPVPIRSVRANLERVNDQAVTRFAYYHQQHGADSLRRLDVGRVMCFPGGFSLEQAQELQAKLQGVVTASLDSYPTDQVRQLVISYMLTLISEISVISETVSSTCDIVLVDGSEVIVAMSVWAGNQALTFAPMSHHVAG